MKPNKPKQRVYISTLVKDIGLKIHRLEVSSTMDLPEGYVAVNSITPVYGWSMVARFYKIYDKGQGRFVKVRRPGTKRGILFINKTDVLKMAAYYEKMDSAAKAMKAAKAAGPPPTEHPTPSLYPTATDSAIDRIGAQLDRVEQRIELLEKHQPRIWRVMNALAHAWGVRVGDEPRPSVDELLGHVVVSGAD